MIHLDPWWNPAVEDQASGKAHRIGQTQTVTVIRLLEDSIETQILHLQEEKLKSQQTFYQTPYPNYHWKKLHNYWSKIFTWMCYSVVKIDSMQIF